MVKTRYRAGSKSQKMWEAYVEGGQDAASSVGKEIGLHPVTIWEYIRIWNKEKDQPQPKSEGKRKVFDIGNPTVEGTVIQAGPNVSEVRWANGITSYTPNDKLLPVGFFNDACKAIFKNSNRFVVMDGNICLEIHDAFAKAKKTASKNPKLHIYALTKDGNVKIIPRAVWPQFEP